MNPSERNSEMSERQAHAEAVYKRLFGPRDASAPDNDPELMEILRRFIFGDVFGTGVLDDQARELITVTVLACLQTLPQLRSHTAAALNVGVQSVEIREAMYQLAPFIGFPRTLNAVAAVNEVFRERGITLPLPAQGTVSDADRYPKGLAEQAPLYGDEIKDNLADLPQPFNEVRLLYPQRTPPGPARTPGAVRPRHHRGHRGPTRPARPGLHPGRQFQERRDSRARALLPLHRIPPRRRRHPCGQKPIATTPFRPATTVCAVPPRPTA
jgi:alkylhydroperoxidase/carboxymuconolactone decarboxylase family protein YurZ